MKYNCLMRLILESNNFYKLDLNILSSVTRCQKLRHISNDSSDSEIFPGNGQKKEKIIVVKKIFHSDPNQPVKVLEWKKASDVIKRVNWENNRLFGPVRSTKQNNFDKRKLNELNVIIQHQTSVPIKEPTLRSESNLLNSVHEKENNIVSDIKNYDFGKILEFPLLNKIGRNGAKQSEINELNVLRKYLESKSSYNIPSVSTILKKTMPKESVDALLHWKQNMIEKLGFEGFEKYQEELFRNGTSLHASINSYLSAVPDADVLVEESNQGHWKSLKTVFPKITEVKLLEERVSHPFLCYKGVVDCFAKYKDHLVVIDWKASKKSKLALSSTFDNPLQIAAYVGALNFDPKFQYLANKGLIVVAYESGNPATALLINEERMHQYWKEWLKRIKLYWETIESSED